VWYSDENVANRTRGFGTGHRNWPLNEGQIPHPRAVRVHVRTGYTRIEGNQRASRNGRVSPLPYPQRYYSPPTFSSLNVGRAQLYERVLADERDDGNLWAQIKARAEAVRVR
jgi:hypothetical protein